MTLPESPGCVLGVESLLCTLAPMMLAFRGVGATMKPVDNTEEPEEGETLRLLRVRSC